MIKHTEIICIYAVPDKEEPKGFRLQCCPDKIRWYMSDDAILLCTQENVFYVDIPDEKTLILKAVETLRDRQKQVLANAQVSIDQLQEKINNLLRLEYKPLQGTQTPAPTVEVCPSPNVNDGVLF